MHSRKSEQSIFLSAIEIQSLDERAAYLDEVCGNDSSLRTEIDALFEARDRLDELPPESKAGEPAVHKAMVQGFSSDLYPSASIGPYKLLEPIGEGGMGSVWLAEQSIPVRRKVALKVIKPGMDTKQVIARFEAERQALAMMDHPNIARIIDGGATASGRPYFVMEAVHGLPITEYCDRRQLSIDDRLELFVQVCRAVQHAHQKGVIHRDLKPSNVLVTEIDGGAMPKVIDFGVAKAVGGDVLTDRTLHTGLHQFVGTPLYVSPEQAEMSGVDVDTRSDIYSLGVLLYELLTGTTPFDSETLKQSSFDEMRRIIREVEPPRPSTRLSSLGDTKTCIADHRRSDQKRLSSKLKGELDWIVMKALEKCRSRRYETANDFAADVMRFLTDLPVEARPPTNAYRFRKFARRNRAMVNATALVIITMGFALVTSVLAVVRAAHAEARAVNSAEQTGLVLDYLVDDVFGSAAPERLQGKVPTIDDMLAAGEAAIPHRFADRPIVEAAARIALGRAYFDHGRYNDSLRHFRRSVSLRTEKLGPDHADTLDAEMMLAKSLCPPYIAIGAKVTEAEPIVRRVLDKRLRIFGPRHALTLATTTLLGRVLSLKLTQRFEEEDRKGKWMILPPEVLKEIGDEQTREIEHLIRPVYEEQVRQFGTDHPDTLDTLELLGTIRWQRGEFEECEKIMSRLVTERHRVLGPDHPATLASRKYHAALVRRNDPVTSLEIFVRIADDHRRIFGPFHTQTVSAMGTVFTNCRMIGDFPSQRFHAERWLGDLLESPLETVPELRLRRALRLDSLVFEIVILPADLPFDANLAERAAREAAAISPGVREHSMLALVLERTGQADQAREALAAARAHPDWNGKSGVYWYALAKLQIAACDFESARESFESAVQDKTEPFIGELNELRNDVARKLLAAEFGAPNH